jgi:HD-GYP domain-containing protein (c-di-GMP phosphodiesterase class II)
MSDREDRTHPESASVEWAPTPGDAPAFAPHQTRRARDVLARLAGARRAVTFYPSGHPVVHDSVRALMDVIGEYHAEGMDVPFAFFEDEVLLGEQLLAEESILFDQLIRDMSATGENSVKFLRGLTADELEHAIALLAADTATLAAAGGLEEAVRAAALPHVEITSIAVMGDRPEDEMRGAGDLYARAAYSGALDIVRDLDRAIKGNKSGSADKVKGAVRGLVENVLQNPHAMLELTGLKNYDEYTFFHSVNVAILSISLGTLVSSDRRFLDALGVGALMHDVGKLAIELEVLNKSGDLTPEEWELMRLHPVYGAEIAAAMQGLDRASIVVILEHHMRYDLDGYPERTPRQRQHLTSRICAIADAYDAMTSRRTYSVARLQDEAMEILSENAGAGLDPLLVRLFVQMMGVYPPRSVVRLTGGEVAIVTRPNVDVLAPHVRVVAGADGEFMRPYDVDLADPVSARGRRVEACLDAESMNLDVDEFLFPEDGAL